MMHLFNRRRSNKSPAQYVRDIAWEFWKDCQAKMREPSFPNVAERMKSPAFMNRLRRECENNDLPAFHADTVVSDITTSQWTQYRAVVFAIENKYGHLPRLGTISDASVLQERATLVYGGPIEYQTVILYRSKWRREHDLEEDCRTYATQTDRDMRPAFAIA